MSDKKIHTLELGRVYEEQGHLNRAAEHFSGALEKDPENPILIAALDRINAKKNYSVDISSLAEIVEQWVHLVLLRQRTARLVLKLEQ